MLGETTLMPCSVCDSEQEHYILALTKRNSITKAECVVCKTTNTYRLGVKTGVAVPKSAQVKPYDMNRRYRRGQTMLHSVFGIGEVTSVLESKKIDVLFGSQTRRLIHDQDPS